MTDKKNFRLRGKEVITSESVLCMCVFECIRVRLYLCVVVRMSRTHCSPQESVNERHKAYTSNIF